MRSLDKHTAVWAGVIVAGTAAFLGLVTRPQFKRVAEAQAALAASQFQFSTGHSTEQVMPQLERELQQLAARNADFEAKLPEGEQLGAYLEAVARSAQEHGLRPENLEPGEAVRSQQIAALPIRLKVHGPFLDVYAFLRDVEALPRLTQIERFKAAIEPDHSGNVAAELQLRIFFRAP